MFYLGKHIDTKAISREMAEVSREASMYLNPDTAFPDDLKTLRDAYQQDGFVHALYKYDALLDKWQARLSSEGKAKLHKTMGSIAASEGQLTEAQKYFNQAIEAQPDNASVAIEMAECFMASGDVSSAQDWFRRAFVNKQNVHTAAKYAEILYLSDANRNAIQLIVQPFLGQSLSESKPMRSEIVVLTLHMLLEEDMHQQARFFEFIKRRNQFSDPEGAIGKIAAVTEMWGAVNRERDQQVLAQDRFSKRFNKQVNLPHSEEGGAQSDDVMDPLAAKILKAYKAAEHIFNDPFYREAASRTAHHAAGVWGAKP